jgi:hypothetical protein
MEREKRCERYARPGKEGIEEAAMKVFGGKLNRVFSPALASQDSGLYYVIIKAISHNSDPQSQQKLGNKMSGEVPGETSALRPEAGLFLRSAVPVRACRAAPLFVSARYLPRPNRTGARNKKRQPNGTKERGPLSVPASNTRTPPSASPPYLSPTGPACAPALRPCPSGCTRCAAEARKRGISRCLCNRCTPKSRRTSSEYMTPAISMCIQDEVSTNSMRS